MIETYNALRDLIDTTLNANPYGIIFDTSLFNSRKIQYFNNVNEDDGVTVTKKAIVPTNIVEIVGDFINIPNTSVTETSISLEFDIFVDDVTKLPYQKQAQYASVKYQDTLTSINLLKQQLLAKRFTLGNSGLFMGGVDSLVDFTITAPFNVGYNKIKFTPKDNDESILLTYGGYETATNSTRISTLNNRVVLLINNVQTIEIPYVLDVEMEITVTNDGTTWTLTDGTNTDSVVYNFDVTTDRFYMGYSIGYFGIISSLEIGTYLSTDNPQVVMNDWNSRYEVNNTGTAVVTTTTNTIENCITWGEDGNVVFGFETLIPIDNVRATDDGYRRQFFGLGINSIISNDLLFGNDSEYFLDGVQVFPVDRQIAYGTELGTAQYINGLYAKSIVEENMNDHTQSFFYKPSKHITGLLKQTVAKDRVQNKSYVLKVQYPFFSETYNVVVDSGGYSSNTNQLATLTVTYKEKDDALS